MTLSTQEITNSDDLIDVRDVIARVEELRSDRDALDEARDEAQGELAEMADDASDDDKDNARDALTEAQTAFDEWSEDDDGQELNALEGLLAELRGNGGDEQWEGDWYPVSLIRDSYFETAMDELLEDIGDIPKNLPPYLTVTVDYDALQMDYSSVEFDGMTYWYR